MWWRAPHCAAMDTSFRIETKLSPPNFDADMTGVAFSFPILRSRLAESERGGALLTPSAVGHRSPRRERGERVWRDCCKLRSRVTRLHRVPTSAIQTPRSGDDPRGATLRGERAFPEWDR